MYSVYVIEQGDTIESIAQKFNTTPQVIYDLNTFSPISIIEVGKSIVVPNSKIPAFDYYTVKKGDTIYSISKMFNITPEIFANLNGLEDGEYIYENETLMVPKEGIKLYLTKDNDTLKQVIQKLNSSLDKMYSQNSNIFLLPEQLLIYEEEN